MCMCVCVCVRVYARVCVCVCVGEVVINNVDQCCRPTSSSAQNKTYRERKIQHIELKSWLETEMYLKDQAEMSEYRVRLRVIAFCLICKYLEYALHMRCTVFRWRSTMVLLAMSGKEKKKKKKVQQEKKKILIFFRSMLI